VFFQRWLSRLPVPLGPADQQAGYWQELSMAQVEVSRTIVFTQPRYPGDVQDQGDHQGHRYHHQRLLPPLPDQAAPQGPLLETEREQLIDTRLADARLPKAARKLSSTVEVVDPKDR
jgi:hypothetical protein